MGIENAKAVVGIVENNGKIILGKKKSTSSSVLSGQWHIPGEKVEGNETDIEALSRGFMEEAGISIEVIKPLGSHTTPKGMIINWYLCRTEETDLKPGSDLEDIMWVGIKQASSMNSPIAKILWPEEVKTLLGE